MPRCPNGYHRSPDGDCEQVNKYDNNEKSSKNEHGEDDNYENDNGFDFTNTINNEKNTDDKSNDPLNQIFSNNNEQSDKKHNDDGTDYSNDDDDLELAGKVTYVVDGDTLDINDIRIRLSLVDTPERGQDGYKEAKDFVKDLCLDKKGEVDIDDGQRRGDRYGRDIGVVYCDGINLNKELMENNLARIYTEYCDISEFKSEK
jgi:micrococcal nuclease